MTNERGEFTASAIPRGTNEAKIEMANFTRNQKRLAERAESRQLQQPQPVFGSPTFGALTSDVGARARRMTARPPSEP